MDNLERPPLDQPEAAPSSLVETLLDSIRYRCFEVHGEDQSGEARLQKDEHRLLVKEHAENKPSGLCKGNLVGSVLLKGQKFDGETLRSQKGLASEYHIIFTDMGRYRLKKTIQLETPINPQNLEEISESAGSEFAADTLGVFDVSSTEAKTLIEFIAAAENLPSQ